ncbi:MAG: hypothetical protein RSD47_00075 [Romboutsia sp.]
MSVITDFYQFKYSRNDYYIELFVNRVAILTIEEALNERLSSLELPKDFQCAYMRLKELFQVSRENTDDLYIELKINKCYLKYIKNLDYYFNDRNDYISLKILNNYLHEFLNKDIENIYRFSVLNEDIKIRVLSSI